MITFKEIYLNEMPHISVDHKYFDFEFEDDPKFVTKIADLYSGKTIGDSNRNKLKLNKNDLKKFTNEFTKNIFNMTMFRNSINNISKKELEKIKTILPKEFFKGM